MPSEREGPPRISVVLPCFNGASYLADSLERLRAHLEARGDALGSHEILVVDDGSSDGSGEIAAVLPDVRVLRHDANRGKGAAVRTGVAAARGRFVFFIDADLPFRLDTLETMLDYLDRKEFHLCIGTRSRLPRSASLERSLLRRFASAVFTLFVSRIVVTGIRDTQCGFKGFRSEAAKYLFSQSRIDGFAFDVEILYLAFKNDLDIKRVPVSLESEGASSVSVLRHGLPMLLEILKLPLRYHTGRYALLREER